MTVVTQEMPLMALPNELLESISMRVPPDDLESYGCTNRQIRSVAAPFVQEHRELKRKYKKISLNRVDALHMVHEMTVRPWIRLYPQHLELKVTAQRMTPDIRKSMAKFTRECRLVSMGSSWDLKHLLLSSGLVSEGNFGVESWLEEFERQNEDFLFAFLLTILPNLERLDIRLDRTRLEQVKEAIRVIKRTPEDRFRLKPLSKLIDARVLEREGSNECDLEIFPLIASLPGIQILHGRNLVGMYIDCYRDGWMTYPGASLTITHMSLETCGMSPEGLEVLCKQIKGLQSFKYIAHRSGWGLHRISDFLKNAQSSLEELVLSTGSGRPQFIGSLRPFTALKRLTVDTDMLIQRERMQRAVDVLPASIETVTLTGNSLTPPLEAQFLADLYRPAFYYPNLRRLCVDDSWGIRDIGKDKLQFQKEFHQQHTSHASQSLMLRYR